ncbi:mitochondrial RNA polymerase [Coprinopsis sp. MPI-PUGE-AT-0042]|nr:mitochondrial RNA polymerase [Coprinopsis sp. MPI-PUGE-AT-0042]
MLSRTAHRLETSLLLSRQSLPRPARLCNSLPHRQQPSRHYSTPSKPAHAPATATAQLPVDHGYPPYMPSTSAASTSSFPQTSSDMLSPFLSRLEYTILPAPLPAEEHKNDPLFQSTEVQDQLAVMDACLHNAFNVPRAKTIFQRLRDDHASALTTDIYNSVLTGYLTMAEAQQRMGQKVEWIEEAWMLFSAMLRKTSVSPDENTYAIMLAAQRNLGPAAGIESEFIMSLEDLLGKMLKDKMDVVAVVANPVIPDEFAGEIAQSLSKTALDAGNVDIVNKLATAIAIASGKADEVPEAIAAIKPVIPKLNGKATEPVPGQDVEGEVPFNIQNLRDHLAYIAYAKQVLPKDTVTRQRHLELSAYDMAESRLKAEASNMLSLNLDTRFQDKVIQGYMHQWHQKLSERIKEEVTKITNEENKGRYRLKNKTELTPYLALVRPDRLSMITILEVMQLTGTGGIASGMKTTRALVSIGKAVELEYKARVCRTHKLPLPDLSQPNADDLFSARGYANLYERRLAAAKQMSAGEAWTAPWSQLTRAQIGAMLLGCLMETAKVPRKAVDRQTGEEVTDEQDAFYHSYEYNRGTKLGVIKVNPAVAERIAKDPLKGTIHPRHLPMLHPPMPWVSHNEGGYLFSRTQLMRFKESVEQEKYLRESVKKGDMELVLQGLNVLGRTAWRINKEIFDVVLQVWNSGEKVGKLPAAKYPEPEPQPPSEEELDVRARSLYLQEHKRWQQKVANNHSERCSTNYKIEIARAFLGDPIYFPHNLDFRGRAYPLPPHLNHIGDDLSRGLLKFDAAKPLGERGLRWLKIHIANLYGFDKADFNEREQWVMDRLELVKDSAHNPLTGQEWWKKADDPWQCLAACMELTAAIESGSPTEYASSLPVHQDGTCNGLQHYAAMGGDAVGAQQVNLAASDRPSDVYTFVGKKVDVLINEDAAKGHAIAKLLQGKITRKVVKQTVMTTVYGVTFIGARDQIEGQLVDRGDIPLDDCWAASGYLAKKVLDCIGDTFHGAKTIQNWLNLCARLISKSISPDRFHQAHEKIQREKTTKRSRHKSIGVARFKKEQMTSVIWTTALGLPVVQPYRKISRKQVMTKIQSVYISDPNVPHEVNAVKQASAFPPNFVHSLDATHMLLTALECNKRELVFASVHDSYWTHACDIDEMSMVIRDTFINLHSADVLGRLQNEFRQRYKGYLVPLLYLQNQPGLQQKLKDAGTRIKVTKEQAAHMKSFEKLLQLAETGVIEEKDFASPEAKEDIDAIKASVVDDDASSLPSFDDLDDNVSAEASAEWAKLSSESESSSVGEEDALTEEELEMEAMEKKKQVALATLLNKFVDITEVFPPLPAKGTFDVNDIKKSPYFFS